MRISYWSADVCSSDLSRHRADRAAKGLAVAGIAQSLAERTLRQSERDRGIHAALGVEGAQQLAEAVFADDQVLKRHLAIIDRSEEHTSELQPLMRISYAVFYCKKKKRD